MAIANPCLATDLFGEQFTFYTDGAHVYFTSYCTGDTALQHSGNWDPVLCFDQPVADAPIAVSIGAEGWLFVTYLDSSGNRLQKYSRQGGDAGTWATYPPPP
jgi:hypothetical protein